MRVELLPERLESIDADALLLPVDGQLCRLGGAATSAIRAALDPDERADELAYLEDELARMRPLPHPHSRAIDGLARWRTLIVSAAYPHNVDDKIHAAADCARMIRAAVPAAILLAGSQQLTSLAVPLIGTAYRLTAEQAVRAFADGVAAASTANITLHWSLPDDAHRELARSACVRLGIQTASR